MKNKETLKGLQSRRVKLEVELSLQEEEAKDAQRVVSRLKSKITVIEEQIQSISSKNTVISEHAMLRLIERRYNLPVEEIRKGLLTEVNQFTGVAQNGKFPLQDGLKAVVKNGVVVTVV